MQLAFLRGPLPGLRYNLAHKIGTTLDRFDYSHSNVLFSDGMSGSCWSKTGVDIRHVDYTIGEWDFFDLPNANEVNTRLFYIKELKTPYDQLGMGRFAFGFLKESPKGYFCHEVFAASQGWDGPWRHGPWLLHSRAVSLLGATRTTEYHKFSGKIWTPAENPVNPTPLQPAQPA